MKPQRKKGKVSITEGVHNEVWNAGHLLMMLENIKTGLKWDKYSGFSNFWFYFSAVEPSCRQKLTQRHNAIKDSSASAMVL